MTAVRRHWNALPGVMRLGFGALGLGAIADVSYHATFGIHAQPGAHMSGLPLAIHMVVAFGMALSLIGVVSTALSHRHRSPRPEGGR